MAFRLRLVLTVLSCAVAVLSNTVLFETKRACSTTWGFATAVATKLQTSYFDPTVGYYEGNRAWTDANTIEDIYNLMYFTNTTTWNNLIYQTRVGQLGVTHLDLWDLYFGGSYDDAGWALLLFIRIRDYIGPLDPNFVNFETSTYQVYDYIAQQWSSDCGGGVWWSSAHTYKNTITNALFMHVSAALYLRHVDKPGYLQNAVNAWNWLAGSGLRDSDNLWFDGLTGCQVSDKRKWTYSQGVIASGLGVLYSATGNTAYLTEAEKTLDAVVAHITAYGTLKESCDDATQSTCNEDQLIFKGIFTKHLQYYIDHAGDAARAKYGVFLTIQSSGVHFYATGSDNVSGIEAVTAYAVNSVNDNGRWQYPGSVWYAQNNGGSIFSPRSMASGLEAHIAAAKYGICY